jgi:hypothetical protein
MNLKPELLATLTSLGITEAELPILFDRMMSLVTSREANINALSAQIDTLTAQKAELEIQLASSQIIAAKLLDPVTEPAIMEEPITE